MADDTLNPAASSRLAGANSLQRSIDSLDRSVQMLTQSYQKSSGGGSSSKDTFYGMGGLGGLVASRTWNSASNWIGSSNGGGVTFGGQSAGAHRADGPAQIGSVGDILSSGGGTRSNGGGWSLSATLAEGGLAYEAGKHILPKVKDYIARTGNDSKSLLTSAMLGMSPGGPSRIAPLYRNSGLQYSSYNAADEGAAMYESMTGSGYVTGSSKFNQYTQDIGAMGVNNPLMSAEQNAQVKNSFYAPRGFAMLRRVGIETVSKSGTKKPTIQIANEVLRQIDPSGQLTDATEIAYQLNDPSSQLRSLLNNWLINGIIDPGQSSTILENIRNIFRARVKGVGVSQLMSLENAAGKHDQSAISTLKGMNIAADPLSQDKRTRGAKLGGVADQLDGFSKGLQAAAEGIQKFQDALHDKDRLAAGAQGYGKGLVSQGPLEGPILAGLSGLLGGGGNKGTEALLIPLKGSGGGWPGLTPAGGNNESRMSVTAGGSMRAVSTGGGGGGGGGGKSTTSVKMTPPCNGPLGAGFGQAGKMWSSGHHTGQDFEVPTGTPIHAAAPGTVSLAGPDGPYGNCVIIDHGNGLQTLYAHNSRLSVTVGQSVTQGQVIAHSGATGNVTGPHCHFEVRVNGKAVNPLSYLGRSVTVSPPAGNSGGTGAGSSTALGSGTSYAGGSSTPGGNDGAASAASFGGFGGFATSEGDILSAALGGLGSFVAAGAGAPTSTPTTTDPSSYPSTAPEGSSVGTPGIPKKFDLVKILNRQKPGLAHTLGIDKFKDIHSNTAAADLTFLGNLISDYQGMAEKYRKKGDLDSWNYVNGVIDPLVAAQSYLRKHKGDTTSPTSDGSRAGNRAVVQKVAAQYGWGSGSEWNSLVSILTSESGFDNNAQNPTSSAYGIFQFLDSTWKGKKYGKTSDPYKQSVDGMQYIKDRYGDPNAALAFRKSHNWYDKGAWEIRDDEDARVHKGEMIIPKMAADQIREILLNGNPYGAAVHGSTKSGEIVVTFQSGAISVGGGVGSGVGRRIGTDIADAIADHEKIKALRDGK